MSTKTAFGDFRKFCGRNVILYVGFWCCIQGTFAQDLMCCSHATGSCRSICEKISLVDLAADVELRNHTISEVQKYCSSQLNSFWECLNATFKDMSRGDSWSGRMCCPLPHSESCRRACITATSTFDLAKGCRQSDEIAFFSCLERQEAGADCCNNARTDDCKSACVDLFRRELSPTKLQRQKVKDYCENDSPRVTDCVKDLIKVTPVKNIHKHIHCCDKSNIIKCRESCKKVLSTKTTIQEIIDGLQLGGCGLPMPQEYFWQCFLQPDAGSLPNSMKVSRIDKVGIDSAKWHCCQKASSSQCTRLCSKTFTKFWATSWDEFRNKCLSQVSEENLRSCIDEVDEPCELGCDGLSFCTNFNNKPTELFRACTSQADEAARNDVALWQMQNNISLAPGLTLPLKSTTKCSPNIWKAVACTLQIKPCSRTSHANQLCRDVCLDILSQCVDWTRVSPVHSPESICESLSPEDPDDSCVRLQTYLNPSSYKSSRITGQVFSPCKGNPCEADEVCLINRNCIHGINCKPYLCRPGCKLGEVSPYMVPDGTYVRVPTPNSPEGCVKICKCNKNKIEEYKRLLCYPLTPCLLGNTQEPHGTIFHQDCNQCSCYAGETICSKKQCESTSLSGRNTAYTTLPCNCPPHYVPVCGRNGITYPSTCLAKCADLNDADIEHYPCQNPCKANSCPVGQKCVPDPQVCLSLMHKPCNQYECINGSSNCSYLPKDPVCDIDNQEYENSCLLAHHNAKLAYRGRCLTKCKHRSQVCGLNGKTYISECAAFADMVAVDYEGPCVAMGLITNIKSKQCLGVKCPELQNANCIGITPPGACCPICGGAMRLLYSRKQIDRALFALQNHTTKPLNLQSVLEALERQIQVAQCTLKGYLSVELDIFVIVHSTERNPSDLQLEACIREAEKIASLINIQSPRIVSELSLSSLTAASIVHTQMSSSVNNHVNNLRLSILAVILVGFLQKLVSSL
ncbi:reversion-inducing cysteine-rich protein with Kazal motifs [Diabrotica undecimpunctata]|uniref:reversion-inducing cysteine-rich protein with Kazal motifs n=1 Tax=Diabrotica undecimpunctata TaxID=50387 RepID=UPI003B637A2F